MATFNTVILIGNLTRDPETRVTPKGTAICQFGLAINREWKDDSGQQHDETTFVDVEAWARQANNIQKYLTKGSPALVQGRLKLDQWEDKQTGQKRSKLKVVCENIQFLGSGKGAQSEQVGDDPSGPAMSNHSQPARHQNVADDSEIPF